MVGGKTGVALGGSRQRTYRGFGLTVEGIDVVGELGKGQSIVQVVSINGCHHGSGGVIRLVFGHVNVHADDVHVLGIQVAGGSGAASAGAGASLSHHKGEQDEHSGRGQGHGTWPAAKSEQKVR